MQYTLCELFKEALIFILKEIPSDFKLILN